MEANAIKNFVWEQKNILLKNLIQAFFALVKSMSKTYIPMMEITSFHCSYYDPTNHGVVLKIKGRIPENTPITYTVIKMNIHGHFWKFLPLGFDNVVKWTYLPMTLGGETWKTTIHNENKLGKTGKAIKVKAITQEFLIEIPIGTKEKGQANHLSRAKETLRFSQISFGN